MNTHLSKGPFEVITIGLGPDEKLLESIVLAAKKSLRAFEPDAQLAARFAQLDEKLVRLRRELASDTDKS